jgi:hypothetical protein
MLAYITRKDGGWPAIFPVSELCCSIIVCVDCVVLLLFVSTVLFYVLFVSTVLYYVLFVCKCILFYCKRVSNRLQLKNISILSYHTISYIISYIISYHIIPYHTIPYHTIPYHIMYHMKNAELNCGDCC